MSKIVQAVNVMIANKEKITDVKQIGTELYFLYDKKYRWSIMRDNDTDDYFLYFYQTNLSIEELAVSCQEPDFRVDLVCYKAREIGTKEAFSTFRDLFQILKEKVLGVDEVLDDIIGDDVPF